MTSRAVLFVGAGRPFEVVRFPTPEPRGAEVLVRVTCCTLCRSDLHTHAGRRTEPTPCVLGHEAVGRVAAFGPDARRVDAAGEPAAVGDRVTWAVAVGCGRCFFCADGLPQKCETPYKYGHARADRDRPTGGGLADHIILVPRTDWFRVPDELPDAVAAPANCATATAAAVLRAAGPVAGRSVLVLGAGVLGVAACAMARANGAARVVAADPSEAGRTRAAAFGATDAVATGPELGAGVRDRTHGRGADVVLELAGTGESAASAVALARTGGTVVWAGTVSPTAPVPLDPEAVVRRMLTIRGVHNYHPRDLHAALGFLAGPGRAAPFAGLVGETVGLDAVADGFTRAHARPGVRVAVVPEPAG